MKKHEASLKIVTAFNPVDAASSPDGAWVSLAHYDSVTAVVQAAAGGAGQNSTVSIQQATTARGAGKKNVTQNRWWISTPDSGTPGDDPVLTVADRVTLDGDKAQIVRAEVTADQLDVDNGYRYVCVSIAKSGNTAKLVSAGYVLAGARFVNAPDGQPDVFG